jgi:hypothetical protein
LGKVRCPVTSRHEWPKTEPCDYCGAAMPVVGYTGTETCPGCGLVWKYDEGMTATICFALNCRAFIAHPTTPVGLTR